MPLTGKFLRYSPEITLEIFTLIYNKLIENKWTSINVMSLYNQFTGNWNYIVDHGRGKQFYSSVANRELTETTVQEILGYDPFVKEKVIPEYVEYIKSDDVGKIAKVLKWSAASYCRVEFPNGTIKEPFKHLVKPSTKEAFDAQNKPIEKWSVGSYFVIEKDCLYNISHSKRGDICIIKEGETFNFINKKDQTNWLFDFREGSRWFATKAEAEEFAKTLVESVKEEVKHPLKQVVHCTTQEEWDFVTEKLGYEWSKYSKWDTYKDNTCINLKRLGFETADVAYKGYQILSFQEWCDLNGYKMEKEVKFEVGDYIILRGNGVGNGVSEDEIITQLLDLNNKNTGGGNINPDFNFKYKNYIFGTKSKYIIRHATPEEINNHLISIGQIPAGEPLNTGIEPNKDGIFKYKSTTEVFRAGGTINNHLEVMVKSTVKPTIELNYLPEPE